MHAKFLPFCWGITAGQVTFAWMWRWVKMLASIERTIVCTSRIALGVKLVEVERVDGADEPQALINVAATSAAVTAIDPRRAWAPPPDVP